MCFSLTASFSAAALLAAIGMASLRKATSATVMVALIPLLFSIQQAAEGCVWLSKKYIDYAWLEKPAAYIFLSFAFFIWPVWNTLALLQVEKDSLRKKYIRLCLIPGFMFIAYVIYQTFHNTLRVLVLDNHIVYTATTPASLLALIVYCLAVVLPLFLSSYRELWIVGMLTLGSLGLSLYQWYYEFGSIWCFLAALISMYIYFIMDKLTVTQENTWLKFTNFFKL